MEDSIGSLPSPALPPIFRNKYWILRHGRSIPNERGLIVSSLENGTKPEFGLAPLGVEQARAAGELLRKELQEIGAPLDSVKILYSPFSRTTETARAVAVVLGIPFEAPRCKVVEGLRERYFGPSYELLPHEKYAEIWAIDEESPYFAPEGGESVADVASRLSQVLSSTDVEFDSSAILFVSHGDPLQIFQAVLNGANENPLFLEAVADCEVRDTMVHSALSQHRKFALLTGELRRVV
ncbi:hypothetical protein PR202_ga30340 [Eleusine coracana subsp. coracana]|uniref:Uncharacterized protein n=1 Tax=Eleusine coracana subsp. coracana TaxID=191504 RepID=A0AAV5DNN1_ELECO|nr:hypothetical protein PR202_ga30340 [Eleusine coracana subsp. coracana]